MAVAQGRSMGAAGVVHPIRFPWAPQAYHASNTYVCTHQVSLTPYLVPSFRALPLSP